MISLQVIHFKQVANSPCLGYVTLRHGIVLFKMRLMYRKETGLFIEFTKARHGADLVQSVWISEKGDFMAFQSQVISQLTENFQDAREIIQSKVKKIVQ